MALDHQHPHQFGKCYNGKFSVSNLKLLNKKPEQWGPTINVLTGSPGDSDAYSSLKTTALKQTRNIY